MEILVERKWKRDAYTIGNIYVNGKRFGDGKNYCNTLEDADRGLTQSMPLAEIKKHKIYGETAIPAGTYKVKFTFSPSSATEPGQSHTAARSPNCSTFLPMLE